MSIFVRWVVPDMKIHPPCAGFSVHSVSCSTGMMRPRMKRLLRCKRYNIQHRMVVWFIMRRRHCVATTIDLYKTERNNSKTTQAIPAETKPLSQVLSTIQHSGSFSTEKKRSCVCCCTVKHGILHTYVHSLPDSEWVLDSGGAFTLATRSWTPDQGLGPVQNIGTYRNSRHDFVT